MLGQRRAQPNLLVTGRADIGSVSFAEHGAVFVAVRDAEVDGRAVAVGDCLARVRWGAQVLQSAWQTKATEVPGIVGEVGRRCETRGGAVTGAARAVSDETPAVSQPSRVRQLRDAVQLLLAR